MGRRAGWLGFAVAAALSGMGSYYTVRNGEPLLGVAFSAVAGVTFPAVGAVIVARRARNRIGWLFLGIGLFESLAFASGQYATFGAITSPGSLPGAAGMKWLAEWTWVPAFAGVTTLGPVLFPTGHPPSPRWRPVVWASAVAVGGVVVASALTWDRRDELFLEGAAPSTGVADAVGGASMALLFLCAFVAVGSLAARYRRSSGIERLQVKWFVFGGSLTVALILGAQLVQLEEVLILIAVPLLPIATAVAILRHRLFDIDVVINRTLVYATLTGLVFGTYVGVVTLFDRGTRGNDLAASLVTATVVAVLFQPLRQRIQRAVNRFMFGYRDEPYRALARVGEGLDHSMRADDVLPGLVEAVAEALGLPYTAIELTANGLTPASFGEPAGEVTRLPLLYQGEAVGTLMVSSRSRTEALSATDLRLIEDIGRQVGIAAHAADLSGKLQRARERLVGAREEERRRLRRDLHDGLGPALAGIALEVEAARNILRRDTEAADRALGVLAEKMSTLISEIRRIVYGLRPPALDELGLVAAIREQTARMATGEVTVEADELGALPAAVEVAAYRIAIEAVSNATRHGGARRCVVSLSRTTSCLEIRVEDDGRGISADARPGVGMSSMRELAEELRGTCLVRPRPGGGTRVHGRLPIDGT